MSFALSLAALALLVAAATTDALDRRIPNTLSVGLALVGLARIALDLATGGAALPVAADLAAAAAVFALGATGFRFGLIGGGDVKLLAAAALWLGAAALLPFLMATALAGGLLAVAFLVVALLRRDGAGPGGKVALPYGIAIAAGAILATGGALWA
ncbi:MAG TPA: prepilin peptidase [Amaricoccus sp.]|nr:prepilin peptidase [Amaricoccus sp.]